MSFPHSKQSWVYEESYHAGGEGYVNYTDAYLFMYLLWE